MNQIKIGKFITERRKNVNLTQMQLAEKLNITDRAVSKWETGRAMPDSSIMLELCDVLQITVNDLLSGEVVSMDNYNKELENKLLEINFQNARCTHDTNRNLYVNKKKSNYLKWLRKKKQQINGCCP